MSRGATIRGDGPYGVFFYVYHNYNEMGICLPPFRDGRWTHGYDYSRVSYMMDMNMGRKTHMWVLSGQIPEIHKVGYE